MREGSLNYKNYKNEETVKLNQEISRSLVATSPDTTSSTNSGLPGPASTH